MLREPRGHRDRQQSDRHPLRVIKRGERREPEPTRLRQDTQQSNERLRTQRRIRSQRRSGTVRRCGIATTPRLDYGVTGSRRWKLRCDRNSRLSREIIDALPSLARNPRCRSSSSQSAPCFVAARFHDGPLGIDRRRSIGQRRTRHRTGTRLDVRSRHHTVEFQLLSPARSRTTWILEVRRQDLHPVRLHARAPSAVSGNSGRSRPNRTGGRFFASTDKLYPRQLVRVQRPRRDRAADPGNQPQIRRAGDTRSRDVRQSVAVRARAAGRRRLKSLFYKAFTLRNGANRGQSRKIH